MRPGDVEEKWDLVREEIRALARDVAYTPTSDLILVVARGRDGFAAMTRAFGVAEILFGGEALAEATQQHDDYVEAAKRELDARLPPRLPVR